MVVKGFGWIWLASREPAMLRGRPRNLLGRLHNGEIGPWGEFGGPVEQDNLYFIHRIPELIPDSIEISNGIYWGGDFNSVMGLLLQKKIDESQIRFFLGYSGWESTQLDQELQLNSWVVVPNDYKNEIIGKPYTNFWKEKMIEFGGDYLIWSNSPENPAYN